MALELTTRRVAGITVICCTGRIMLGEESAKLRHVIKEELSESNRIVLDLGGITHIDSTGLGALAGLHTSAVKAGGTLSWPMSGLTCTMCSA